MPERTGGAGSRGLRTDRNPGEKDLNYSAGDLVAHGNTSRGSYTVPAGKRAVVQGVRMYNRVSDADAAAMAADHRIQLTRSGSSAGNWRQIRDAGNVEDNVTQIQQVEDLELFPGDKIEMFTQIVVSNSGKCDVVLGVEIFEYEPGA